jgi:predicted RecA/RadA family phage recombinase
MRNYIKSGKIITATASRTLLSGAGMLIGSLFSVATTDVTSGSTGEFQTEGVFSLDKTSAEAWTAGDPIYWNNTTFKADNSSVAGELIGIAESAAANPSSTGRVRLNTGYSPALAEGVQRSVDITITSAQLLALNATARQIVAAPGAGKAIVLIGVLGYKAAGTAYAGIAAGEDIAFKYTNSSGTSVGQMETTGFLDQTTAQVRYTPAVTTDHTPVANAALVAHLLTGEIITGDSDLVLRVFYRVVPTTL